MAVAAALLLAGTVASQITTARRGSAATTFTVNRLDDPAVLDDCSGGTGSLRACVAAALASSGNVVNFSVNGTITLTQGHIRIIPSSAKTLTINGNGIPQTIIDGNNADTVFFNNSHATTVISNMTIQHGNDSGPGGGIQNQGTLTLTGVLMSHNHSVNSDSNGGAVANINNGHLTIINSTLSQNTADSTGSQSAAFGGAVSNFATGEVSITGTTLSGNQAIADTGFGGEGGAIYYDTGADTVVVQNSTITGNQALGSGVGSNSPAGGGVFSGAGEFGITNTTIANNAATRGGNLYLSGNGNAFNLFTLKNDIVSGAANNCLAESGGSFTDGGYNLDSNSSSSCGFSAGSHDVIGHRPVRFSALRNNVGLPGTMAITSTSPAYNAGSPDCPLANRLARSAAHQSQATTGLRPSALEASAVACRRPWPRRRCPEAGQPANGGEAWPVAATVTGGLALVVVLLAAGTARRTSLYRAGQCILAASPLTCHPRRPGPSSRKGSGGHAANWLDSAVSAAHAKRSGADVCQEAWGRLD